MYELHDACKKGDSILVITLLDQKNKIDELDEAGLTPICHAARAGHFGIVAYLADRGANLSGQSTQDLRTNVLYQISRCANPHAQLGILTWLRNNFSKLKFTDGTQKQHIQLALSLLNKHKPITDKAIFNDDSSDRLSLWIKAKFCSHIANAFFLAKTPGDGLKYLQLATQHYEKFQPTSDQELRDYFSCLQSLLYSIQEVVSHKERIALIKKIFSACQKIAEKQEADFVIQAFNAYNLAETYRVLDKMEKARSYYLTGLDSLLELSADADKFLGKIPDYFFGLVESYPRVSRENKFFNIAMACFLPAGEVKDELLASLNDILKNPRRDLYEGAIMLLYVIIHVYNLDLLQNRQLVDYFNSDPDAKSSLETILKQLENLLIMSKSRQHQLQFFTTRETARDQLDNNLPPESLERTHAWTLKS